MAKFVEVNTDYGKMFVNLDTVTCISKDKTDNNTILSFSGLREDLVVLDKYENFLSYIEKFLN